MTVATMHELKVLVERAVRPVRGPRARKKAMREELLAHLVEVFEDELARRHDESQALASTRTRFGDSAELTGELQRTVTLRQRAGLIIERLDWTQDMSFGSLLRRNLLLGLASVAFMFLLIVPSILFDGRRQTLEFALRVAIMQGMFVASFGCLMGGLCPTLGRALFGDPGERSWGRVAWCLLGAAAFLPIFAFVFYWGCSGDLSASADYFVYSCRFAPLFPLLCVAVSRQVHRDHAYERHWAELELVE